MTRYKNPIGKTRRTNGIIEKPHGKTQLAIWQTALTWRTIMELLQLQSSKERPLRSFHFLSAQCLSLVSIAMLISCACNGTKKPENPVVEGTTSKISESVETQAYTGEGCMRTGCSGQICAPTGEAVITTCQWREEYLCYKTARCERQGDGNCGWTPNESLMSCLKSNSNK